MAIYHMSVKTVSRSSGRSAPAAAAYRAGEKIQCERDGKAHDYSRRSGVLYTETFLPEGAPKEWAARAILWNAAESADKRKDSRPAREVETALPKELSPEGRLALARGYAQYFASLGMAADLAVHAGREGQENPHAHILLATRTAGPEGFGKKEPEWNKKSALMEWRREWEREANRALEMEGRPERVDHRSLEAQGIDRAPEIHLGQAAAAMERRGERSERGDRLRGIQAENRRGSQSLALSRLCDRAIEAGAERRALEKEAGRLGEAAHAARLDAERLEETGKRIDAARASLSALKEERAAAGLFSFGKKRGLDADIAGMSRKIGEERAAISESGHSPDGWAAEAAEIREKLGPALLEAKGARIALSGAKERHGQAAAAYLQAKEAWIQGHGPLEAEEIERASLARAFPQGEGPEKRRATADLRLREKQRERERAEREQPDREIER